MKKIIVDENACIGCGLCVATLPEVFRINADGVSESYQDVLPAQESKAQTAIENCPVSAISWQ